jgi:hypothetical protein
MFSRKENYLILKDISSAWGNQSTILALDILIIVALCHWLAQHSLSPEFIPTPFLPRPSLSLSVSLFIYSCFAPSISILLPYVCTHAEVNRNFHSKYEFDWIPHFFCSVRFLVAHTQASYNAIFNESLKEIHLTHYF